MSHLIQRPPQGVVPPSLEDGLRRAQEPFAISPMVAATNEFLVLWLRTIANDACLPSEAVAVASVMARSVGVGRVSSIDWQQINIALGRNRRDTAVLETLSELYLEGYLDRNLDVRFGLNYGWLLLLPEGEL